MRLELYNRQLLYLPIWEIWNSKENWLFLPFFWIPGIPCLSWRRYSCRIQGFLWKFRLSYIILLTPYALLLNKEINRYQWKVRSFATKERITDVETQRGWMSCLAHGQDGRMETVLCYRSAILRVDWSLRVPCRYLTSCLVSQVIDYSKTCLIRTISRKHAYKLHNDLWFSDVWLMRNM